MLLINLLLWYDFLLEAWNRKKEQWKEWCRTQLGPSPVKYYSIIFPSEDVIPSTLKCPYYTDTIVYYSHNKTIMHGYATNCSKFVKVPWLSLQCKVSENVYDFSDWLSEVKFQTVPSLLSIVRLAAQVHNVFIREEYCKVEVINRDGEEKTYVFRGCRQLVEEKPIKHRDTMPYDNSEKIDPNSKDCMWGFYY